MLNLKIDAALIEETMDKNDDANSLPFLHLGINKVIVTKEPSVIRTVLGSCVSVCLYDSVTQIGGMNHYMLPFAFPGKENDVFRFGNTSIPLLIKQLKQAGGRQIKAKIIGGANIFFDPIGSNPNLSVENIRVAREILKTHAIAVQTEDVGGNLGRVVTFYPHSGLIIVKKQQKYTYDKKIVEE